MYTELPTSTEICPKYGILKKQPHGMLKNNEPRQACKDPFIYTEFWHYSVRAAYARTHLQAVQRGPGI